MPCSEILKCYLKSPKRATKFAAVALIVRFGFSSEDVGRKLDMPHGAVHVTRSDCDCH
jgi:hypothetical protein